MQERRKLIPSIVTGVMGNSVIYLIPLLVGSMVTDRGFSEQQAGLLASADLAGYAIATFFTAIVLHRFNWRKMAYAALAVMIVANIGATFVYGFGAFAAIRFFSGIGCGVLAAIATVSLGHTEKPDKSYGLLFAASLLFGTAALWGLPVLLETSGLNGAYILIACLALLIGFVVRHLPEDFAPRAAVASDAKEYHWILVGAVLVAITLFWAEQNALYAYMERIGNASGLTGQYIGFALGAANLTGFVGAALVASIGSRFGRALPIVVSTVVQLACLWSLSGHLSPTAYLVAIGLISLAWNVVNPYQLGVLAMVDPGGRALAMSATVVGVGLAAGPAMAAVVVGSGGYDGILWLASALAVLSVVLIIPALRPRP